MAYSGSLNVDAAMRHRFAALGYCALAIGNDVQHGIVHQANKPGLSERYARVAPLRNSNRPTVTKLILNAAGDPFFLPDSS